MQPHQLGLHLIQVRTRNLIEFSIFEKVLGASSEMNTPQTLIKFVMISLFGKRAKQLEINIFLLLIIVSLNLVMQVSPTALMRCPISK